MVIVVKQDSRVYRFSESSTIICEVFDGFAEVLVLPDRRRFLLKLKPELCEGLQSAYPEYPLRQILAKLIASELSSGYLQVDEELSV
jgi:hypothetical protein